MRTKVLGALVLVCMSICQLQAEEPLISKMGAFLVTTDAEGKEQLKETETIEPGQLVEYVLTYTNQSDQPLQELKIVGPVPSQTAYQGKTTRSPEGIIPRYSVDGGKTFHLPPVKIVVVKEDGTKEERIAAPEEYNAIQWLVPVLPAETSLSFKYRVTVK